MKRLVAMLLCCLMAFSFTACGSNDKDSNDTQQAGNTQQESQGGNDQQESQGGEEQPSGDALSMLTAIWDNFPEDNKFFAMGGSMASPVDGAPGKFDTSDADGMTGNLLLPESVQANVDDIASLFHGMMLNNFTGAVIHVTNGDAAGAASEIKSKIVDNQWTCGFPEKLTVLTAGDYVIYAFGLGDLIDSFSSLAQDKLGATEAYSELLDR